MKSTILAVVLSSVFITSAVAGDIVSAPPPEAEVVLAGSEHMGDDRSWWLALIALGVVLLLLNDGCESNRANEACGSR